jgi:DNA-binding NarL/FixJ family response regulator
MSLQRRRRTTVEMLMNLAAQITPSPSIRLPSPEPAAPRPVVSRLHLVEPAESVAGDDLAARRPLPIRALIADGQRLVRAGLRRLFEDQLDIAVTGEAASGDELVTLVRSLHPDVVVVDVGLPGLDGFEATRRILAESPSGAVGVVLLVDGAGDESMLAALEAGATGVLIKDSEELELLRAVRAVAGGGALLDPHLTRRLIARCLSQASSSGRAPAELSELTPREREVMVLVAAGLSNAEIAERLVVTPATAKTHVSRARRKLGARDRAQLVMYAFATGLVTARPTAVE